MTELTVRVIGRPAPQGSHEQGANGYIMHSSKYLDAWRHAVNRDTRRAYVAAGLTGDDMPLIPYPRPVHLMIWHVVLDKQCRAEGTDEPTGSPDDDKLLRATIDGLGEAHVFANDSQVTQHFCGKRRRAPGEDAGAYIRISDEPIVATSRGETTVPEIFTPNGQYRVVLERVGTDADGDKTWETVIEVTDTADAVANTWLPSIGVRLGRELPAEAELPAMPAPVAETPKTRRPRKAAAPEQPASGEAVVATMAAENASAPPMPPEPAPVAQAPAEPPAAAPARVNPFARP